MLRLQDEIETYKDKLKHVRRINGELEMDIEDLKFKISEWFECSSTNSNNTSHTCTCKSVMNLFDLFCSVTDSAPPTSATWSA